MTRKTDIPRVQKPPSGDGHHITSRYLTATELAERDDQKGRIYEWDSKTGAIEMYDKQGKHLGEFNHETGEQIDPAKPGRFTAK